MRLSLRLLALLLCFFSLAVNSGAAGEKAEQPAPYRIVFSTFESDSAGRYAYLKDSIQTMLASRLASGGKITVLDSVLSEKQLVSLAKDSAGRSGAAEKLQADFLVSGALFAITSGLNIQVEVHPLAPDLSGARFSTVTDPAKSLISDVEKLAGQIRTDALGLGGQAAEKKGVRDNLAGRTGFITEHPEVAYKKKVYAGAFSSTEGSGVTTTPQGVSRSIEIPLEMIAMTVGDLDSDGQEEVLILSESRIQIFKLTDKALELVDELKLPADKRSHAINTADINGDGLREIYISATLGLDVSSMILIWNKTDGLRLVADRIPWYLRPMDIPGKGVVLMGQRRGLKKAEFIRAGIYRLDLDNNYEVAENMKIALPGELNLFNFVYADLDGEGASEIVAVDNRERMRVYSAANELLWVSKRSFGGSTVYLGPSRGDAVNDSDPNALTVDEEGLREPIFVPNPIIVKDFDGDGTQEIIVNENEATFFDLFYKLRIYESSLVTGLNWTGNEMREVWRTGKYRGVIAAYGFASLFGKVSENAAKKDKAATRGRLFLGYIPAKGTLRDLLPGSLDSEIKVYDLEFSREKRVN